MVCSSGTKLSNSRTVQLTEIMAVVLAQTLSVGRKVFAKGSASVWILQALGFNDSQLGANN